MYTETVAHVHTSTCLSENRRLPQLFVTHGCLVYRRSTTVMRQSSIL